MPETKKLAKTNLIKRTYNCSEGLKNLPVCDSLFLEDGKLDGEEYGTADGEENIVENFEEIDAGKTFFRHYD